MATALPTEQTPIRMAPELAERVEAFIKAVPRNSQDKAREAVMNVYHSAVSGSFDEIAATYQAAIAEAVAS